MCSLGKIIGEKIDTLLKENNIKQKELAEFLQVTDNTISYFVRGTRTPNLQQIISISNYFDVSTDYLLGKSDIQTSDTTVKDICEYTGLIESSLEFLKKINSYKIGDFIDMPVNSEKDIHSQVTCEYDRPSYIVNLLLNNPHIVGLIYSFMCLFNEDGDNDNHIYQGDKGFAILFDLMSELRTLRDGFQSYYKNAFYDCYKKDESNGNDK